MAATRDHYRYTSVLVPKLFEKATSWDNLSWVKARNPAAYDAARAFAEDPIANKAPLLIGASGTGKTHLFWAAAFSLAEWSSRQIASRWEKSEIENFDRAAVEGKPFLSKPFPAIRVLATSGAEVAHQMRDSVKDDRISETVDRYCQKSLGARELFGAERGWYEVIPVLLLDDIEVMKMSDWLAEELYRIIDHRYAEMKPTLMVTNLVPDELRAHLGDRIARRILDMTKPVMLR